MRRKSDRLKNAGILSGVHFNLKKNNRNKRRMLENSSNK